MIIDNHFHFMAQGDTPGCFMSPRQQNELAAWLMHVLLGTLDDRLKALLLRDPGPHPNSAEIRERLLEEIYEAKETDGAVLLGLDALYHEDGTPEEESNFVVTNDYLAQVVQEENAKGKKKFYLGASVHPYRPDALSELRRVKNLGAALIKWIPSSQQINPEHPKSIAFYEKLAELDLPLLCHAGFEGAITVPEDWAHVWEDPGMLQPALECGATVIFAHCASPYFPKQTDYVPTLERLFRQADQKGWKIYADISALLLTPWRAAALREFLFKADPERLIYGSDFPIPTYDLTFGQFHHAVDYSTYIDALRARNMLDKDVLFKRALGIKESVFHNTAKVLKLV